MFDDSKTQIRRLARNIGCLHICISMRIQSSVQIVPPLALYLNRVSPIYENMTVVPTEEGK